MSCSLRFLCFEFFFESAGDKSRDAGLRDVVVDEGFDVCVGIHVLSEPHIPRECKRLERLKEVEERC